MKPKIQIIRLAGIAAVFAIWEAATASGVVDPSLAGRPSKIMASLVQGLVTQGDLWPELVWTMGCTLFAFLLGSFAAVLAGMLFVLFPLVEKTLDPVLSALNAMPRIALAPMLIVWFGLGMGSKIAIGFSLTFFIVLQSTIAGGRSVNPDHITLSRTLGINPVAQFWSITMPSAVPVMFAGLRLGLVAALLGVVGGEIIASERGLGQKVAYLAAAFDMNGVWAILLILAAIGMLMAWSLDRIEAKLLSWR